MARVLSLDALAALDLPGLPERIARRAMPGAVKFVTEKARELAPKRRSGPKSLVAKINGKVLDDGVSGVVQATARHAHLVHDGTAPHEISVREKTDSTRHAMRYVTRGSVKYRSVALHPGATANPFLDKARDESVPDVEQILRKSAELEIAEVSGDAAG